jgi:hypothetical protein
MSRTNFTPRFHLLKRLVWPLSFALERVFDHGADRTGNQEKSETFCCLRHQTALGQEPTSPLF